MDGAGVNVQVFIGGEQLTGRIDRRITRSLERVAGEIVAGRR